MNSQPKETGGAELPEQGLAGKQDRAVELSEQDTSFEPSYVRP